ncbi:hypothetical protein GCM10009819_10370 [Agromyces tropicus]|uniref:Integral membrane protein n=1 Tax=Agromyces tropicus TaxID=555371 RepID=A0ABN2U4N5_9MICO
MPQDEVARNETQGQPADDAGSPPPRDERPRPRYGEYAPEGWSWQPPADERAEPAAPAPTPPPPPAPVAGPAADPAARPPRSTDRFFTILLLAIGAVGAWNTSVSLQQLPVAVQALYTDQGIGTYSPQPWLSTLTLVGTVFMLALYAAILGWAILRMRARKVAFWVPLVGGALAFLAMMVISAFVFLTDPTFQAYVDGIAGG